MHQATENEIGISEIILRRTQPVIVD